MAMLAVGCVSSNPDHGDAGEFGPERKGVTAGRTRLCDGVLVWASGENVRKLVMGGRKPPRSPPRLEPLYKSLSSLSRSVEFVGSVVEAFVRLVSTGTEIYPRGRCTPQRR